ncbi:MAG: hypothetical protein EXQ52_12775 [Bryobacterales bacterium]|nr:hypothetical protein [Bryobacterales bacterium]
MIHRKSAFFGAIAALVLPLAISAQEAPKTNLVQQPAAQQSSGLKIIVVQGEGALNSTRARTATQPVVEVRDDSDKPVAGAEVVFQLPAAGPGGVFNGWMRTQTTRSGADGKASASGFTPNDEEGRFNIKVTATAGTKSASAIVGQSNGRGTNGSGAKVSGGRNKIWLAVAIIGVGAIAGGVGATRGDDKAAATAASIPVSITPGAVTVGGPR